MAPVFALELRSLVRILGLGVALLSPLASLRTASAADPEVLEDAAPTPDEGPVPDAGPALPIGPQLPEHLLKLERAPHRRKLELPIVAVRVNGRVSRLAVDTGASTHLISQRLLRSLDLEASEDGHGVDHVGDRLDGGRVERVTISAPGWVLVDRGPVGTAEIPPDLQKLGVDGFLSPQLLATPGHSVVLDLEAGLLWTAPEAEAKGQLRGKRLVLTPPWGRTCQRTSPLPFLLYVLPAIVEGTAQGLLIDTGASHTNLLLSALVGTRLVPGSGGRGTGFALGGRHHVQRLPAANIRIGQFEATRDLPLFPGAPSAECHYDGALGLDVLSACTLVLSASQAAIACRPN